MILNDNALCVMNQYVLCVYMYVYECVCLCMYVFVCQVSSMGRALAFRADGPGSIPGPA